MADCSVEASTLCRLLGQPRFYVDKRRLEIEIIAAAKKPGSSTWAWVESRAVERKNGVGIRFLVKIWDFERRIREHELYTYNPFFGCAVGYFAWHEDTVVTIYAEKHDSYIACFPPRSKPRRQQINDRWFVNGDRVSERGFSRFRVFELPTLEDLGWLDPSDAEAMGLWQPNWPLRPAAVRGDEE